MGGNIHHEVETALRALSALADSKALALEYVYTCLCAHYLSSQVTVVIEQMIEDRKIVIGREHYLHFSFSEHFDLATYTGYSHEYLKAFLRQAGLT